MDQTGLSQGKIRVKFYLWHWGVTDLCDSNTTQILVDIWSTALAFQKAWSKERLDSDQIRVHPTVNVIPGEYKHARTFNDKLLEDLFDKEDENEHHVVMLFSPTVIIPKKPHFTIQRYAQNYHHVMFPYNDGEDAKGEPLVPERKFKEYIPNSFDLERLEKVLQAEDQEFQLLHKPSMFGCNRATYNAFLKIDELKKKTGKTNVHYMYNKLPAKQSFSTDEQVAFLKVLVRSITRVLVEKNTQPRHKL